MDLNAALAGRPIALLGCGKMGAAMLDGWRAAGLPAGDALVVDPHLDPAARSRLAAAGARIVERVAAGDAGVVVLAVKPQSMAEALPAVAEAATGSETLVLSIAAGLPIAFFEARLPAGAAVVRAMPNTPSAVGAGVTAIYANAAAGSRGLDRAEALLRVVGDVVRLADESEMDAVTAVSGSGPAYVFHVIEALAAAGVAEGLAPELAHRLALATVAGAGRLAAASSASPTVLRENVTSKGGTTAAGLSELMNPETGLTPLLRRTVAAAARRSRELGE